MRPSHLLLALGAAATVGLGIAVAQDAPGGDAPAGQYGGASFEVSGIDVDVAARTAGAARTAAYREAQRKGWQLLYARMTGKPVASAPRLSDSAIDAMVSGIVVEREQIGPNRYIARLGVMFDRGRAGQLLGISGQVMRSPPMLMIPVIIDGGAAQSFEQKTPWTQAWSRYRTGASPIDYIRPGGTGADAALLTYAQTRRPDRDWWLTILDQYGASDVLVAEARLDRQWPGGPVIGQFIARHGPDGLVLGRFRLRIQSTAALDQLFDAAVQRVDAIYTQALRDGRLKPDPALQFEDIPKIDLAPDINGAAAAMAAEGGGSTEILVDTPDAAALAAAEALLRSTPGVTGTSLVSLSLGTATRLQLRYGTNFEMLRWNLDQRGWRLDPGGDGLRLRRRRADEAPLPRPVPPPVAAPAPAVPVAPAAQRENR